MHKLNRMELEIFSTALVVISLILGSLAAPGEAGAVSPKPAAGVQQKESDATNQGMAGKWLGVLDVGGTKLRLVLKIGAGEDNSLRASLDSLDQGAMDLKVDSIVRTGSSIRAELNDLGAVYEGQVNSERTEILGEWKQGPSALPLTFRRITEVPALLRPQEPQKPYPYTEEEVVYENKQDKVKLAGTLTIPRGAGPHPAVVLVTGSGPEDRNETVAGHKPFLILADYLTRRGIAVLRADDRGVGGSSPGSAADTSENYAGDALSGIQFLKTRKEINARQIGLIGHSEGGMIVALAAVRSTDVAYLVMLAGPGVPGDQLLYEQARLILKASGADDELVGYNRSLQQLMIKILREERTDASAERRLRTELPKAIAGVPEEKRKALGITEASMEGQFNMMMSPWFRYFLAYDPRPILKRVRCPVLAIGGERDLQVPARQNLPAIGEALKAGGNKDYTTMELPGLNHLLQTSRTGSPAEYTQIEETISPKALEVIGDWIIKHTTPRPAAAATNSKQ
ncbi:MAG TPA: alpha/beta hydrolase [Pyrinomonadaceae bacterium]|nr:alpha/beta hydrolase [Pyrinomonadaceae bacterium]